jgi:hypothetical protein
MSAGQINCLTSTLTKQKLRLQTLNNKIFPLKYFLFFAAQVLQRDRLTD